jgi:murein DD-endopeptidase MepM/ murein hydrolase activator NlpD
MHARTFGLAAIIMAAVSGPASACELAEGAVDGPPLVTRKPIVDPQGRFISGYGLRRHPILGYNKMHTGVDWGATAGTDVIAAGAGRVGAAGRQASYGTVVIVEHGGGWRTLYAHLSTLQVREGDCVAARAVIGTAGTTGLTTISGVHFEVQRDGQPIDPMKVQLSRSDQR